MVDVAGVAAGTRAGAVAVAGALVVAVVGPWAQGPGPLALRAWSLWSQGPGPWSSGPGSLRVWMVLAYFLGFHGFSWALVPGPVSLGPGPWSHGPRANAKGLY